MHEFCHTIDGALRRIDPDLERAQRTQPTRTPWARASGKTPTPARTRASTGPRSARPTSTATASTTGTTAPSARASSSRSTIRTATSWSGRPSTSTPSKTGATPSLQTLPKRDPAAAAAKFKIRSLLHEVHLGARVPRARPRGQRRGPAQGQRHDPQDVRLPPRHPQGPDRRRREAGRARPQEKTRRPARICCC